jgi:ethanolamine utilization microcompartment shell protein EutL
MITLIAITCILVILYVIFRAVGGMERSLARRSAAKSAAKKEEITVVQQRDITSGAILARRKVTPELLDLIAERSTENLKPLDVITELDARGAASFQAGCARVTNWKGGQCVNLFSVLY